MWNSTKTPFQQFHGGKNCVGKFTKTCRVLSGGGAHGACEIGTLKALLAGKYPTRGDELFDPEIFCGTSVSAFKAAAHA